MMMLYPQIQNDQQLQNRLPSGCTNSRHQGFGVSEQLSGRVDDPLADAGRPERRFPPIGCSFLFLDLSCTRVQLPIESALGSIARSSFMIFAPEFAPETATDLESSSYWCFHRGRSTMVFGGVHGIRNSAGWLDGGTHPRGRRGFGS